ncbi:MAG: glycoside hydrolase domain-containing protein [Candidatus Saccharicenans sp.]|uniref:glycoside hydrolase domain-containing protein n=1 Tax=Candidatus Saccharicenans sp. TaxID=2819258 RepID=UPI00404961FC
MKELKTGSDLKIKLNCFSGLIKSINPELRAGIFIIFFLSHILRPGQLFPHLSDPTSDSIEYRIGTIPLRIADWNPDSGPGNHRAVVRVSRKADAVYVRLPWRRPDREPEKKRTLVFDASGREIKNVFPVTVNNEYGDFVFQAAAGPGDYYFYYFPYKIEGRNYPKVTYLPAEYQAETGWLLRNGLRQDWLTRFNPENFPRAEVLAFEVVDEFSSFYPMEIIATENEVRQLLEKSGHQPYLVFPEDRRFPVRMTEFLPARWAEMGPRDSFEGQADRGEYYVFQLGLFAPEEKLEKIRVRFSDLKLTDSDRIIPAALATCFNTGGTGWDSREFEKEINLEKGQVQPLWCGWQIPEEAVAGEYTGQVVILTANLPPRAVNLKIKVSDRVLPESGDSELWRLSRLRWLNSLLAVDEEVVPPFIPLQVKGKTIACLGREIRLSKYGLPEDIRSFFNPEVTAIGPHSISLLDSPFELSIRNYAGLYQELKNRSFTFTRITPGAVSWKAENEVPSLHLLLEVNGRMEFDGFVEFRLKLTATEEVEVDDIRLTFALKEEMARYMIGLGFKGGRRPQSFSWSWDREKNQDALWLGTANAGLQIQLRAENYSRPLNTNFYNLKPLNLPPSWWNEGRGWVSVKEELKKNKKQKRLLFTAAGGPRKMKPGEALHFDFNLLLTPFKPINPGKHFSERYYHAYKPLEEIAASGANVINVHHANEINPYINYPFLRPEKMKAYIDQAHRQGFKVKIYYTIRELSNRAAELFPLKSLGNEIFTDGPGGGYSWLQEHLGSNYIAGWFVPELKDAAIINSGMSRWHNYYIESLAWLCRHVGLDGLYIDDVAFDRVTMKRARKVLEKYRPGSLIDLHSANQYNPRDGFASSANLYLEHFPYIDRLWFGEYFDYNSPPDYWLVEMSGIPFGLMGEMLEKGGNPWRGMVFGMTARLPWSGDPRPLWKVWDEFGISDAQMIGFWSPSCPVKTGRDDVLATVYLRKDKALVALASWAVKSVDCQLNLDWKKLGIDQKRAVIEAPAIESFQPSRRFQPGEPIPVEPGRGWLLLIKNR